MNDEDILGNLTFEQVRSILRSFRLDYRKVEKLSGSYPRVSPVYQTKFVFNEDRKSGDMLKDWLLISEEARDKLGLINATVGAWEGNVTVIAFTTEPNIYDLHDTLTLIGLDWRLLIACEFSKDQAAHEVSVTHQGILDVIERLCYKFKIEIGSDDFFGMLETNQLI